MPKNTYRVTFKDGRSVKVKAHDNIEAKRIAVLRRYDVGTTPELLDKSRNVAKVETERVGR